MTAATTTLPREIATDMVRSAPLYAVGAVAGAVAGGIYALIAYTPPLPAPSPTPAAVTEPFKPAPRETMDGEQPALVSDRKNGRRIVVRGNPTWCVQQVAPDGRLLGDLCTPDPDGSKANALGSVAPN